MKDPNDFYAWFAEHHKTERFTFPEVPSLHDVVFERLTQQNAVELYRLFQADLSPFVDGRFKDLSKATEYATYLERCGAYTAKHGSADWLFRFKDGDYIGVLHLYDLSLETFAQNHKRAWIGFATKEEYRRAGLTSKVVRHFIKTVFDYYPAIDFIHAMTDKKNGATANFLGKCGFLFDPAERLSKKHDFYLFTRPSLS